MSTASEPTETRDENLLIHALAGAAVAILLGFIPFSPLLGGAVAGYLHRHSGVRVGAAAGLIASIPLVLGFLFAVLGFSFFAISPGGARGLLFVLAVVLVGFVVVLLYTVGLSVLGGVVGERLAPDGAESTGDTPTTLDDWTAPGDDEVADADATESEVTGEVTDPDGDRTGEQSGESEEPAGESEASEQTAEDADEPVDDRT